MTTARAIPFDLSNIAQADKHHWAAAEQVRGAIGVGVLMSLGATRLTACIVAASHTW